MNTAFKPTPVIITPKGEAVTLGQYVDAWNKVKALPAGAPVKGWQWFEVTRESVLSDFSHGVQDRINKRGNIPMIEPKESRIYATLEKRVSVSCRWCGQSMVYRPTWARFCSLDCHRAFNQ